MTVRRSLSVALSFGALFVASKASAAPAPPCTPATIVPRAAHIPANLPAFAYTATTATASNVRLTDNTTNGVQSTTTGRTENGLLSVLPSPALVEGHSYTLDADPMCSYGPTPAPAPFAFVADPAAPLPTAMGAAPASPTAKVSDFGTSGFTITTTVAIDPSIKPWLSVYQIVAVVDGKPLTTKLTQPDADTISLSASGWCDSALSATVHHSLTVRGRLPFAPTVDTTATALDFSCPAPAIGTSGSDPAVPGAVTPIVPGAPTTTTTTSGGCNAGGAPLDVGSAFALFAIVSAWVAKRRR